MLDNFSQYTFIIISFFLFVFENMLVEIDFVYFAV